MYSKQNSIMLTKFLCCNNSFTFDGPECINHRIKVWNHWWYILLRRLFMYYVVGIFTFLSQNFVEVKQLKLCTMGITCTRKWSFLLRFCQELIHKTQLLLLGSAFWNDMHSFGLHVVHTLIHVNPRHRQSASLSNAFLSFALLSNVSYDQGILTVGYQLCPYFNPFSSSPSSIILSS